ncbi:MAG TPA: hypothetical protein VFO60_07750, partial [Candidatus Dormibacteraeota bacterium]|nr:hypothetical protein [Candidatus Dormibacteraeota bacterium]
MPAWEPEERAMGDVVGTGRPDALNQVERVEPVAVIGAGYVGLVTGACMAAARRSVTLVEIDRAKRERIARGDSPIHEPGLDALLRRVCESGALQV